MAGPAEPILAAHDVSRVYRGRGAPIEALRGVSLVLRAGELVALRGPSGSGKSTLLHLCGAMDRPTGGRILLDGVDLGALPDEGLTDIRRRQVGFVFQFFNLLPTLTVLENIALPLLLGAAPAPKALDEARRLAGRVGLAARLAEYPATLSGGEAQRVAIARAVVHRPRLVIADEPTGNLDSATGQQVLALLTELNQEEGVAVLLATHADEVARRADRVVYLQDGRLRSQEPPA